MKNIPAEYHDLLKDEHKALAYLATVMDDGTPQVTPVWFNTNGEYILINTAEGRVKDHNMQARPHVALCIADPGNPYRYLQIRGKVAARTTEGADAHINTLAHKYTGQDWNIPAGEQRVIYKISPEKINAH